MTRTTNSLFVTALFGSRPRIVVSAAALALLAMAAAWAHPLLLSVDGPLSVAIRGEGLVSAFRAVTTLGGTVFVVGTAALLVAWVWVHCRPTAAVFLGTMALGATLNVILKVIIGRPRPLGALTGTALASFPSGHTIMVTLLMGMLPIAVYVVTKQRWAWRAAVGFAVVVIAGVGFSRIYLGAHWPTDVIGGIAVGMMLVAAAELALVRWIPHLRCKCALA